MTPLQLRIARLRDLRTELQDGAEHNETVIKKLVLKGTNDTLPDRYRSELITDLQFAERVLLLLDRWQRLPPGWRVRHELGSLLDEL